MPSEAASGGRPRPRDRRAGLRRRSTRCPPADPPARPTRRPGHVGCDRRDRPSVQASTSPGGAASRVAGSPRGWEGPEAGQAQPPSVRRRSRPPAIPGPAQQSAGGRPQRGSARPCRALATPARAHRRRACSSTCLRARRGRSSTDRPLHAPPTREPNPCTYRIRSDTAGRISRPSNAQDRHIRVWVAHAILRGRLSFWRETNGVQPRSVPLSVQRATSTQWATKHQTVAGAPVVGQPPDGADREVDVSHPSPSVHPLGCQLGGRSPRFGPSARLQERREAPGGASDLRVRLARP